MATDDGLVHLVFNGEILNYRDLRENSLPRSVRTATPRCYWRSTENTGRLAFLTCRGQFAYAIHDAATAETHFFATALAFCRSTTTRTETSSCSLPNQRRYSHCCQNAAWMTKPSTT